MKTSSKTPKLIARSAHISPCGYYRYELTRDWVLGNRLLWVMFNPSTADAIAPDPTITRCINFSDRLGFTGISVINLYAFRTSKPTVLRKAQNRGVNVVGPETDAVIYRNALQYKHVICAWGANAKPRDNGRIQSVVRVLKTAGCHLRQLGGLTTLGEPRHPLMLKTNTPLQEFLG